MSPQFFFTLCLLAVLVLVLAGIAFSMTFRFKRRELEHRERMVAMERGATFPILQDAPTARPWQPGVFLLRGTMWMFSGIALMTFLIAISVSGGRHVPASERAQRVSYAKSVGASEEQIREIMNEKQEGGLPPEFALIGLVPMGVGLAYLITYKKEKDLRTPS